MENCTARKSRLAAEIRNGAGRGEEDKDIINAIV